jgi:hypothetical protein
MKPWPLQEMVTEQAWPQHLIWRGTRRGDDDVGAGFAYALKTLKAEGGGLVGQRGVGAQVAE